MSPDPDDLLLDELAALLGPQHEPPPEVLHAAREVFTWRTVDAELAALTFDSLLDAEPARSRSIAEARTVTFEAGSLAIEVEVDVRPHGRRLVGQLVPPQVADVEWIGGGDAVSVKADPLGRFVFPLPSAPHPVRVIVSLADGTRIASECTVL